MDNTPPAPWWATEREHPDPNPVEYVRHMENVPCADSREEVPVFEFTDDIHAVPVPRTAGLCTTGVFR